VRVQCTRKKISYKSCFVRVFFRRAFVWCCRSPPPGRYPRVPVRPLCAVYVNPSAHPYARPPIFLQCVIARAYNFLLVSFGYTSVHTVRARCTAVVFARGLRRVWFAYINYQPPLVIRLVDVDRKSRSPKTFSNLIGDLNSTRFLLREAYLKIYPSTWVL